MIDVAKLDQNFSAFLEKRGNKDERLYNESESIKDDLVRSAIPIIAEQIVHDRRKLRIVATACILSYKNRFFFVTANHVREENKDVALGIFDSGAQGKRRLLSFRDLSSSGQSFTPIFADGSDDDLLFFEIKGDYTATLMNGWRTIPIENIISNRDEIPSTSYIACGFCGHQPRYEGAFTLKPKTLTTNSLLLNAYPELGFDPNWQLLLNINGPMSDGKGNFKSTSPRFKGMSGGPVWNIPDTIQHLLGKRFQNFSGIVIESPKEGVMRITAASAIVSGIGKAFNI